MATLTYDQLKAEIERYGVHPTFGGSGELDAGIEQNPGELATFLVAMQAIGVQSVLEIGTGYKGGLSRFLVAELGWHVTTVDTQVYGHKFEGVHYVYVDPKWEGVEYPAFQNKFDLVLIDAKPTYEAVKDNWEYYSPYASKAIALHDIAGLRDCEGVAAFWYDMAYQGDGEIHAGFYEAIADSDQRGGIGWQVL